MVLSERMGVALATVMLSLRKVRTCFGYESIAMLIQAAVLHYAIEPCILGFKDLGS